MVAERADTNEPFVSGFDPVGLARDLRDTGLELLEDVGPRELQARYCAGRADGLCMTAPGRIAHARVAQKERRE